MTDQPEIFIVETVQPSIEIDAATNVELQILEPLPVTTVEVSVPGPQGPRGLPAPVIQVKIDSTTSQIIYVGSAEYGTEESDSNWTIIRTIYDSTGVRISRGTAINVTWIDRTNHIYS